MRFQIINEEELHLRYDFKGLRDGIDLEKTNKTAATPNSRGSDEECSEQWSVLDTKPLVLCRKPYPTTSHFYSQHPRCH